LFYNNKVVWMVVSCNYPGAGEYMALAWALAGIGYAIGLALSRLPSPGGATSQWGGYLMSYSLAAAGFIGILGAGTFINGYIDQYDVYHPGLLNYISGSIPAQQVPCKSLPDAYMLLGMRAFGLLALLTGIGMGSALIPIIGPALANVFSVVATVPGLALSVTLITAFTLMTFIIIFGKLAVALAPLGVALMAVPGGKLKGIGAWLVAAAIVFAVAGPYIPAFGTLACEVGERDPNDPNKPVQGCSVVELTGCGQNGCSLENILPAGANTLHNIFDLVSWLFNPQNNTIMKMWRFALGSLAGWGILMAAAAALSKGMGGVAASLGFG
jgi:hypothetical protein